MSVGEIYYPEAWPAGIMPPYGWNARHCGGGGLSVDVFVWVPVPFDVADDGRFNLFPPGHHEWDLWSESGYAYSIADVVRVARTLGAELEERRDRRLLAETIYGPVAA